MDNKYKTTDEINDEIKIRIARTLYRLSGVEPLYRSIRQWDLKNPTELTLFNISCDLDAAIDTIKSQMALLNKRLTDV